MIVCSKEEENNSRIVSKLLLYKNSIILKANKAYQNYLRAHFCESSATGQQQPLTSSIVDPERYNMSTCLFNGHEIKLSYSCFVYSSCVHIVSSLRPGMGKSLYINRLAQKLGTKAKVAAANVKVVIPIHGPVVNPDVLLTFLREHYKDDRCKLYHFDISPSVSHA